MHIFSDAMRCGNEHCGRPETPPTTPYSREELESAIRRVPAPEKEKKEEKTDGKEIKEEEEDQCIICFNPIMPGEDIAVLPCLHRVHYDELIEWCSTSMPPTCPMCRTLIQI
jgi:hypothetical protein